VCEVVQAKHVCVGARLCTQSMCVCGWVCVLCCCSTSCTRAWASGPQVPQNWVQGKASSVFTCRCAVRVLDLCVYMRMLGASKLTSLHGVFAGCRTDDTVSHINLLACRWLACSTFLVHADTHTCTHSHTHACTHARTQNTHSDPQAQLTVGACGPHPPEPARRRTDCLQHARRTRTRTTTHPTPHRRARAPAHSTPAFTSGCARSTSSRTSTQCGRRRTESTSVPLALP